VYYYSSTALTILAFINALTPTSQQSPTTSDPASDPASDPGTHCHGVLRRFLPVLRQTDKRHLILLANLQTGRDGCITAVRANIASLHRLEVNRPKVDWSHPHPHRTSASHRLFPVSAAIVDHIVAAVQHTHVLTQQVTITDLLDIDVHIDVDIDQPVDA